MTKLSPEQIYNAGVYALNWRCMPQMTLKTKDDGYPAGTKDPKQCATILACYTATGTHRCKLMVSGRSQKS